MYRLLKLNTTCWKCLGLTNSKVSPILSRGSIHKIGSLTRLFGNCFLRWTSASSCRTTSYYIIIPVIRTLETRTAACHSEVFNTKPKSCINSSLPTQHFSTSAGLQSSNNSQYTNANRTTLKYIVSIAIVVVGLSYAAVPLYRVFCQASGYGGTVALSEASEKVENMEPIRERELTIRFNADTSAAMLWQFKPHQTEIKLVPGETALAFYTARNPTDKPVTGIATYNVIPFEAGLYFNKIQCFCFEEQRLNPNEQVDMPVFFYIDPEFNDDPALAKVDTITLSYTFFEAKEEEGIQASLPATV